MEHSEEVHTILTKDIRVSNSKISMLTNRLNALKTRAEIQDQKLQNIRLRIDKITLKLNLLK